MQVKPKIVLFGPAHSGKSTLAGYLQYQSSPAASEGDIARARQELGTEFDESQALAYLVDRSADERRRTQNPKLGTSKRLHVSRFNIVERKGADFFTLDTPGYEQRSSQRFSGISFADAGVYCLEAKNLLSFIADRGANLLDEYLSLALTWSVMKPSSPLLIALTKMDLADGAESTLKNISRFKREAMHSLRIFDVVPISINVAERRADNILSRSFGNNLSCFFGAMINLSESLDADIVDSMVSKNLIFISNRVQRDDGIGTRAVGKVMLGRAKVGESICAYQRGKDTATFAKIRKIVDSPDFNGTDWLGEGDLGGITIAASLIESESVMLCDVKTNVKSGNILKIAVGRWTFPERAELIGRNIQIVYLGSGASARIVDYEACEFNEDIRDTGIVLTIIIRAGAILWVPFQLETGSISSTFRSVFLSMTLERPGYSRQFVMSGIIEECGSRVRVQFRDRDFGARALATHKSGHDRPPPFDPADSETDHVGIEYLLALWRDFGGTKGRSQLGPLEIEMNTQNSKRMDQS